MQRDVGIWIDRHSAALVRFDAQGQPEVRRLDSGIDEPTDGEGHHRASSATHRASSSHKHRENRREELLKRYYEQVIEHIAPEERVHLIGPNGAKQELLEALKQMNRERQVERVEPESYPTESQLIARFRGTIVDDPERRSSFK